MKRWHVCVPQCTWNLSKDGDPVATSWGRVERHGRVKSCAVRHGRTGPFTSASSRCLNPTAQPSAAQPPESQLASQFLKSVLLPCADGMRHPSARRKGQGECRSQIRTDPKRISSTRSHRISDVQPGGTVRVGKNTHCFGAHFAISVHQVRSKPHTPAGCWRRIRGRIEFKWITYLKIGVIGCLDKIVPLQCEIRIRADHHGVSF